MQLFSNFLVIHYKFLYKLHESIKETLMSDNQKIYYISEGVKNPATDEIEHVERPLNARDFVEHILATPGQSDELVPVSIRLTHGIISCADNNSKFLGMSKSEFYRAALRIGINEITAAYEGLTSSDEETSVIVE